MASPAQMDRDRLGLNFSNRPRPQPRRDFTDVSGFTNIGTDRSKPEFLTPAKNIMPVMPQSRDMGALAQQIFDNRNTGVMNMLNRDTPNTAPAMTGSNIAQQVLGKRYNQAISAGYEPTELIDMVNKANSYGRGINVEGEGGFGERLDQFMEFKAGNLPNMLSMNRPQVTANAPTLAEAFQDFVGGVGNFFGDAADRFAQSGPPLLQIINEGIDKLRNLQIGSPAEAPVGTVRQTGFGSQELNDFNSLNRSQQNTYIMLRKNLPHDVAFKQAQNQRAMGGIATLQ